MGPVQKAKAKVGGRLEEAGGRGRLLAPLARLGRADSRGRRCCVPIAQLGKQRVAPGWGGIGAARKSGRI